MLLENGQTLRALFLNLHFYEVNSLLFKSQIQGCIAKTSPGCSVAIFALRCVVSGAFGSLGGPCGNPLGALGSPVGSVCLASLLLEGPSGAPIPFTDSNPCIKQRFLFIHWVPRRESRGAKDPKGPPQGPPRLPKAPETTQRSAEIKTLQPGDVCVMHS